MKPKQVVFLSVGLCPVFLSVHPCPAGLTQAVSAGSRD